MPLRKLPPESINLFATGVVCFAFSYVAFGISMTRLAPNTDYLRTRLVLIGVLLIMTLFLAFAVICGIIGALMNMNF